MNSLLHKVYRVFIRLKLLDIYFIQNCKLPDFTRTSKSPKKGGGARKIYLTDFKGYLHFSIKKCKKKYIWKLTKNGDPRKEVSNIS